MSSLRPFLALVAFVLATFAAAAIGSLGGRSVTTWYTTLAKPALNPPAWVFGPVWTLLYAMMAVAAWLVWRKSGFTGASVPLVLYAAQLALNALWSILFFGLHSPALALIDLALLWLGIVVTLVAFWRVTPVAGALLIPYLAWVSFASYLNYAIWSLNR